VVHSIFPNGYLSTFHRPGTTCVIANKKRCRKLQEGATVFRFTAAEVDPLDTRRYNVNANPLSREFGSGDHETGLTFVMLH